jgi:hypothetical protein
MSAVGIYGQLSYLRGIGRHIVQSAVQERQHFRIASRLDSASPLALPTISTSLCETGCLNLPCHIGRISGRLFAQNGAF